MPDFFEELAFVARYLDPKGQQCFVYSFSLDSGDNGQPSDSLISFVTDASRNDLYALVKNHGMPSLYYAWGMRQERLPESIEDRAYAFDEWLRNTPEDEIRAATQPRAIEEYHVVPTD